MGEKLTKSERDTLADLKLFDRPGMHYAWRSKGCAALEVKGLAQAYTTGLGLKAWRITEAGRRALSTGAKNDG